jgi:deazaflavin-dependent oxidoreductase (nitroreductase family)
VPLYRRMATFNRRVTNHLTVRLAGRAPGFAIVEHVGRRSGRHYETPVNVFAVRGTYLFALTYGEGDWVKNVFAAGGCAIRTRGRRIELREPARLRDPGRRSVPVPARWVLGLAHVEDFVVLRPVVEPAPG